jgi:hypothetical protein
MSACFDVLGSPLPWQEDPIRAFERLFPHTTEDPRDAAVRAGQPRMLDFVASRFEDLLPKMSAADRERASLHRDLIRDLETRIGWLDSLGCEAPASPTGHLGVRSEAAEYPDVRIDAFFDLVVSAFSCGLTDVITLRMDDVPTATVGAPPGTLHQDVAHAVNSNDAATEYMIAHHTFHARKVAQLLDVLSAIPEGEGTMLDNTLVVWHNEMSTGDHLMHTVPFVLAGLSDTIRGGTYLRTSDTVTVEGRLGAQRVGLPHNRVLTSIGRAMGLDTDATGEREIADRDGGVVDCTGALEGVLR